MFELICNICFQSHGDGIFSLGAVHLAVNGRPGGPFWGRFSGTESTAERGQKTGSKLSQGPVSILLIDIDVEYSKFNRIKLDLTHMKL